MEGGFTINLIDVPRSDESESFADYGEYVESLMSLFFLNFHAQFAIVTSCIANTLTKITVH